MVEEEKQLSILLYSIKECYGYNLDIFNEKYLRKRVREFIKNHNKNHICDILPNILTSSEFFYSFFGFMTTNYTTFFREPETMSYFKNTIIPKLKTYPKINIWHAGCSTGEEPYSVAIILDRENLLDRTAIYATDISQAVLAKAKKAVYREAAITSANANYLSVLQEDNLMGYFTVSNGQAALNSKIRKSVTFAHHNIVSDASFGEMNVVFFRNVLIYFKTQFQNIAINNISKSLKKSGYLILTRNESLVASQMTDLFYSTAEKSTYQKI